ncbi:hypothetical protein JCM16303_006169 [Sporobolomyces ruberrimus]
MPSPARPLSELQAALDENDDEDDLEPLDVAFKLNKPSTGDSDQLPNPFASPSFSTKGSGTRKSNSKRRETLVLDDTTDEEGDNLSSSHKMIDVKPSRESLPPLPKPTASTSSSSNRKPASKKHARGFSESDTSSSDLEILPFLPHPSSTSRSNNPTSSTSRTPSTSLGPGHKDKKSRLNRPSPTSFTPHKAQSSPAAASSSTSTSTSASLKSLESSINSLLTLYTLKRVTRPEYISKKIQLRDEAKELGIMDFDEQFGYKFEQVEREMEASSSRGKDSKGKGKAKMERDGVDASGRKMEDGVIDRRLTSAQFRAKEAAGGMNGKGKGPRPNAEILMAKKIEWDQAKIVPLTFGGETGTLPGGRGTGLGQNRQAMERAKKRSIEREAKRKRELRKKGIKGEGGIDGWIAGASAAPSSMMPGGYGASPKKEGGDSDYTSDDSEVDYSDPDDDRKILARIMKLAKSGRKSAQSPAAALANIELQANFRRIQNTTLRSTKAVDDAVKALGMKSQKDRIPGMKTNLLDFQWIGLDFMAKREMDQKVPGGVLADEMGLGKTVQTIALIMARRSHDPEIKTNLVVVPLSLLSQWEDEIGNFAVGQSVHIYHGSNKYKSKSKEELLKFDVVLTTHSTLSLEWPASQKRKKKKDAEEDSDAEEKKEKEPPGLLYQVCWYRVVIDEAHVARTPNARISKAIAKLDAVFRWALTGTPMINSLRDYYSLHRFLRNRPWREYGYYQKAITSIEKKSPVDAGRLADTAIGPLTLRRRKTDQLGGKALVTLPPKKETQINLTFDVIEREIYDAIEAGYQAKVNKFFRAGTLLKNFHFILVLILRLKQLCCHPHLMAERVGAYNRKEELDRAVTVLGAAVVKRIQEQRLQVAVSRAQADDLEDPDYEDDGTCPVCGEMIIGAAEEGSVTPCGHVCCTICLDEILNEPAEDDMGETRGRKCKKGEAPCPLCRAPYSRKSLLDLECFEPEAEDVAAAVGDDDDDDDDDEDEDEDEDDADEDVKPKTTQDKKGKGKAKAPATPRFLEISDDEDEDLPDPSNFFDVKPKIKPEEDVKPKHESLSRVKNEDRDLKPYLSSPSVRDIKPVPSSSKKPKNEEGDAKEEEKPELQMSPLVPSTKMIYVLKMLRQYEAEDAQKIKDIESGKHVPKQDEPEPITKTIILSQFVGALDLLDRYLAENGILSVRFQGSTSPDERKEAISLLAKKNGVRVMLLSTKAGGVGLNLTSACRVLSFDLAWSRAVEAQAFDRTYRLGQRRPVEIERIIVNDTIEERILNLQARKTLLSDMSLAEGQGDPDFGLGNISVPEVLSLFRLDKNGEREGSAGPGGRGGTPRGRGRGRGGFRGGRGRGHWSP